MDHTEVCDVLSNGLFVVFKHTNTCLAMISLSIFFCECLFLHTWRDNIVRRSNRISSSFFFFFFSLKAPLKIPWSSLRTSSSVEIEKTFDMYSQVVYYTRLHIFLAKKKKNKFIFPWACEQETYVTNSSERRGKKKGNLLSYLSLWIDTNFPRSALYTVERRTVFQL